MCGVLMQGMEVPAPPEVLAIKVFKSSVAERRNDGLEAPCNGDPNVYEAFQMEAIQLFGTPNEILNEVINSNLTLIDTEVVKLNIPHVYPNPFLSEILIKGDDLLAN